MLRKLRMGQIKNVIGLFLFCAVISIWMLTDTGLSCITALMGAKPLSAAGVKVSGTLEILEGEDLSYYNRMARKMDLDSDAVVYHISDGRIHGEKLSNVYGITALACLLFVFAMYILIMTLKNSPQKTDKGIHGICPIRYDGGAGKRLCVCGAAKRNLYWKEVDLQRQAG